MTAATESATVRAVEGDEEAIFDWPEGWGRLIPVDTREISWHPDLGVIARRRVYDSEGNPLPWEYDDDPHGFPA